MACSRKSRRLLSRDLTLDDFVLRPLAKNATLDLSTPFRRHRLKDPDQGDVLEELLPRGTIGRAPPVERLKGRSVRLWFEIGRQRLAAAISALAALTFELGHVLPFEIGADGAVRNFGEQHLVWNFGQLVKRAPRGRQMRTMVRI